MNVYQAHIVHQHAPAPPGLFVSGAVCTDDVQGVELCKQVVADEHKVDFQVHKVVADVHKVQVARWQGARLRWAWWRAASPSCGD